MSQHDLVRLLIVLIPAGATTALTTWAARPLLARSTLRLRMLTVALVGVSVGLANLAVLAWLMFASGHDVGLIVVLLAYAGGAGVGAALAVASSTASALRRVQDVASELAEGNLSARVGPLRAGTEVDALARALDEMAGRLESALARERELDASRRDLVTAVSHDLRTPLASLRAMVEAVDEGVVDDAPTLKRYAGEMRRSVDQLVGLVDDLFELVQVEAGVIEHERDRARLEDVVRAALAVVEPDAERKRVWLLSDLGVAGDLSCSPRLTRVLQNLLVNAVRHTPADGSVRIQARRDDQRLEVSVEDTGEGIDPIHLDRVFDPFYRADAARSGGGAGLGLALARRIVEALGGRISVESKPAKGSRFAVTIPLGAGSA
jgi:signal transduction histidine kinase